MNAKEESRHEVNANNSDYRDRPQIADDDDPDSQALTNGDITRYRALVARISYLSQDRPDLKFASMQVCCAMAKPTMRDMERVKRIGRYLVGKPCWFRWQRVLRCFQRVPIGVSPCSFMVPCWQGVHTFISFMHLIPSCIDSSHNLEGSDAPVTLS